jgi:hypothetical protein
MEYYANYMVDKISAMKLGSFNIDYISLYFPYDMVDILNDENNRIDIGNFIKKNFQRYFVSDIMYDIEAGYYIKFSKKIE